MQPWGCWLRFGDGLGVGGGFDGFRGVWRGFGRGRGIWGSEGVGGIFGQDKGFSMVLGVGWDLHFWDPEDFRIGKRMGKMVVLAVYFR